MKDTKKRGTKSTSPRPKQTAAPLIVYSPEVESHREYYRNVGASLSQLLHIEHNTMPNLLDIESPGVFTPDCEPPPHIICNAAEAHLRALFENIAMNYDDDFWTTLYVELRLYYDQKSFDMQSGMYRYKGMKEAKKGGES